MGTGAHTESIAIANLGLPAADQMAIVRLIRSDLWVGISDELYILAVSIRLDMVELDGVDIFPPSKDCRVRLLHLRLLALALLRAVQDRLDDAALVVLDVGARRRRSSLLLR